MKAKKTNYSFPLLYILLIILFIIIIGIIIYAFYQQKTNCPINHVCLKEKTFNKLVTKNTEKEDDKISEIISIKEDPAILRDRRVLNDPLFPPLNRTDRMTFNSVAYETKNRNINIPTNSMNDRFRQVGYISAVSQEGEIDSGGGSWKLMARQKDRNESEFYMIPTNKNYDIKVPLTPEVVVGPRLRDIYTIPNELKFKSPLLNKGPYEFVELPKTDFTDSSYM